MSQLLRRRGIVHPSGVIIPPPVDPPPSGGPIAPPIGPWTTYDGGLTRADFAEQAYIHTGGAVSLSKIFVKNCTDRGVGAMQWQPPSQVTIPGWITCTDCKADHIMRSPPHSGNGTCEAGFWFGNPVKAARLIATNCGWMGIWTGNRCIAPANDPSIIEDFLVTGSNMTGVYLEHDTVNIILRRGLIDTPNDRAVIIEWWYGGEGNVGTMHGSHDILFDNVEFKQEVFLDAGTYGVRFRNCTFWANVRLPNKLMDPYDNNVATANRNYTQSTHPNPNVVENNCIFKPGAAIAYHTNNIGWGGQ